MPEGFTVNDRRSSARQAERPVSSSLVLGQSVAQAKAHRTSSGAADRALALGRTGSVPAEPTEMRRMATQRMNKVGSTISGGNGSVNFASSRPHDPFFYWQQNNLPYDFNDPRHLILLRELCRHVYKAHSVMASCIDIYSFWPLTDMEFQSKDPAIVEFYSDLFFDTLDYEEFLPSILHEYFCALPGEMVQVSGGTVEVEKIQAGDQVLTHRGRFRDVSGTSSKHYSGTFVTLRPHYEMPLRFTEGHQVYVRRPDGETGWIEIEKVTTQDQVFVPVDTSICEKKSISLWEVLSESDWEVFDSTYVPVGVSRQLIRWYSRRNTRWLSQGVRDGDLLRPAGRTVRGRMSAFSPEHDLTDGMLKLMGFYVAEGCATRDGLKFAFNGITEMHLMEEVADLLKQIFGLASVIDSRTSQGTVIVNDRSLSAWFGALFGYGAMEKRLPLWMMRLPSERISYFLDGYYLGDAHAAHRDGSTQRVSYKVATASSSLRDQVAMLIRRSGFVSVITETDNGYANDGRLKKLWNIGPAQAETVDFARYLGWSEARIEASFGDTASTEPKFAQRTKDGYWVKVFKTEKGHYSGPVYNFEVEDDHSYVCSVAVHNCVGEAFPLGSFNETLGVWDNEELLNPDDVFVEKSPFIKDPNLYIRLPESLRRVLTTGQPPEQYHALMRSYPELAAYTSENTRMPVSDILLKHMKFKGDNFSPRGLPIMYRALRPLMQEEMLNAAQDAIADRLYTPLILAKIGASATDLGTDEPWIPTEGQIASFENSLDAALAADFRVLTTHFAVQMESVFGRETMPNFDADFDRMTEKQLQAFGISKTMLSGGGANETYAADALNRDLISQLLGKAQKMIQKFVKNRMLVVAEAQGHYDYEVRGGKRYPIMEEILEVDENGNETIVEQPKLLVPELSLKVMNLADDEQERSFLEALRASGVPISQKRRLVNIDIDLDQEIEATHEEQVEQALEAQRVRKDTYLRLLAEKLPIPDDLKADFQPKATGAEDAAAAPEAPSRVPTVGIDGPDTVALAPTPQDYDTPPGEPLGTPAGPAGEVPPGTAPPAGGQHPDHSDVPANGAQVINLPRNRMRPPESDEMRAKMPKPASLDPKDAEKEDTSIFDLISVAKHTPGPPVLKNVYGEELYEAETDEYDNPIPKMGKAGGIVQGPRHINLRRYAGITRDTVLGVEPDDSPDD